MREQKIEYQHESTTLEAHVAYPNHEQAPVILIFHAFAGRDAFACSVAKKVAEWGYVGFAADMYGKGVIPKEREECIEQMTPFVEDRGFLQERVLAAYDAAKKLHPGSPIGCIGFCFGGLCALDLARSGADIRAAVSFHGLLKPLPQEVESESIQSKILICHGYDDPQIPVDQVHSIQEELTQAEVDWQLHIYGGTMHAFTLPSANDHDFGTVYNKKAAQRAFDAARLLFQEVFNKTTH